MTVKQLHKLEELYGSPPEVRFTTRAIDGGYILEGPTLLNGAFEEGYDNLTTLGRMQRWRTYFRAIRDYYDSAAFPSDITIEFDPYRETYVGTNTYKLTPRRCTDSDDFFISVLLDKGAEYFRKAVPVQPAWEDLL